MTEATMPVTVEQAAQAVIESWDSNTLDREKFCEGEYGSYWSPHAAMVNSEQIAALRAALNTRATPPAPAGLVGAEAAFRAGFAAAEEALGAHGSEWLLDAIENAWDGYVADNDPTAPPTACTVPPEGWWCSRQAGHEGPCAARPIDTANGSRPDRVVEVLERIANDIVRDVCELPGDDDIEADDTLIVSADDLRVIVERNLSTLDAKDQSND